VSESASELVSELASESASASKSASWAQAVQLLRIAGVSDMTSGSVENTVHSM
jgi:hypothetical protein